MTCGIYKITNTANHKIYVGQSMDIEERIKSHFYALRANRHTNKELQKDFNQFGEQAFSWEILEECESHLLNRRESIICYELNVWDPEIGYNKGKLLDYRHLALEKVEEIVDTYLSTLKEKNLKLLKKKRFVFVPLHMLSERLGLNRNDTLVLFKSLTGKHEEKIGLSFRLEESLYRDLEGVEISLYGENRIYDFDLNL
jgi:group I intron endonuclease